MTEAEFEAELNCLRGEVAELRNQQERQQKHWMRWGQIFIGVAVALYLFFMAVNAIYCGRTGMPDIVGLLIFVSLAFSLLPGPRPPMSMSIRERLKWVWSA